MNAFLEKMERICDQYEQKKTYKTESLGITTIQCVLILPQFAAVPNSVLLNGKVKEYISMMMMMMMMNGESRNSN